MKITVSQLRQIIREEIQKVKTLNEELDKSKVSQMINKIDANAKKYGFKKVSGPAKFLPKFTRSKDNQDSLQLWRRDEDGYEVELYNDYDELQVRWSDGKKYGKYGGGVSGMSAFDLTQDRYWKQYIKMPGEFVNPEYNKK
jgi:hypothetical protein